MLDCFVKYIYIYILFIGLRLLTGIALSNSVLTMLTRNSNSSLTG